MTDKCLLHNNSEINLPVSIDTEQQKNPREYEISNDPQMILNLHQIFVKIYSPLDIATK